jgi:hypothetical protein
MPSIKNTAREIQFGRRVLIVVIIVMSIIWGVNAQASKAPGPEAPPPKTPPPEAPPPKTPPPEAPPPKTPPQKTPPPEAPPQKTPPPEAPPQKTPPPEAPPQNTPPPEAPPPKVPAASDCQLLMCTQIDGNVAVAAIAAPKGLMAAQDFIAGSCPGEKIITKCDIDCNGPYNSYVMETYWIWKGCVINPIITNGIWEFICDKGVLNVCQLGVDPDYPFSNLF